MLNIADENDIELNDEIVGGRMYNIIESFDMLNNPKSDIKQNWLTSHENGCTVYNINLELIFKTILGTTTEEE